MRIVFMGTPDFAVPCLLKLIENGYEIAAVVSQPDKPSGRKHSVLQPTPIKSAALEHGVKNILQPVKVRTAEFVDSISELKPDFIVTAAYGRILTRDVLDIPRLGCINVHGSLLPKYRGAAPIQWAIINGDKATGITTMYMDEGTDTGDILLQREVPIPGDMTYSELYESLRNLGAEVLLDTLKGLADGTIARKPQNHAEAVTVPMMTKEMGMIDWKKSAREIHNLVRGTDPWPGAFTYYRGTRLKIWKTRIHAQDDASVPDNGPGMLRNCSNQGNIKEAGPGTVSRILKDSLLVQTGAGCLEITELQFESARRMSARECGHNMNEGEILG